MLYPSINEIRKKADSRYTLVILAAQRARDIIDGKPSLLDEDIERPVSVAAHEIAEDYLTYRRPDPAEQKEAGEEEAAAAAESDGQEEPAQDAAGSESEVAAEAEEAEGDAKAEAEPEDEYVMDEEEG